MSELAFVLLDVCHCMLYFLGDVGPNSTSYLAVSMGGMSFLESSVLCLYAVLVR